MSITRILWDESIARRISEKHDDVSLILSALKDIDSRISDLEEQHNEMEQNLSKFSDEIRQNFVTDGEINNRYAVNSNTNADSPSESTNLPKVCPQCRGKGAVPPDDPRDGFMKPCIKCGGSGKPSHN